METIRNYLEAMFANMPNTPEVIRAKDELWQMMEDNYEELIAQGKTENEAIGTVIAEFGNINDLDLNLGTEVLVQDNTEKRYIDSDTAKHYIEAMEKRGFRIGIAVMLCITCVIWPILFNGLGAIGMFAQIGIAVAIFINTAGLMRDYTFVEQSPCYLDYATSNEMTDEYRRLQYTLNIRKTIGVLLCAMCWVPAAVLDEIPVFSTGLLDDFSAIILFIMVGTGVLLLIHSAGIMRSYERLLNVNDGDTVSAHYKDNVPVKPKYINKAAETVMEVFWPLVTCGYLCWSFLTFNWGRSWIVFPIGAAVFMVLKACLISKDE